jgi:hypothetical protein
MQRVYAATTWLLVGWIAAWWYFSPRAPVGLPLTPPAPVGPVVKPPAPVLTPVRHTGYLIVSHIEKIAVTPAAAAVRDQLGRVDWASLDATFRSYTEGQVKLTELGFTRYFQSADLPLVFIQESTPAGAPIIKRISSPASAEEVLRTIKELRGS